MSQAHKPLLLVEDNQDGTIYIEAGFSDGTLGAGHTIILKEQTSGKVLAEYTIPESGALDVPMPDVAYTVTFETGPGHSVTKDGPAPEQADALSEAARQDEESAVPTPSSPSHTHIMKTGTEQVVPPQPSASSQPVVIHVSEVDMAFKTLLTTQLLIIAGLFFVFGAIMFCIGYVMGKRR